MRKYVLDESIKRLSGIPLDESKKNMGVKVRIIHIANEDVEIEIIGKKAVKFETSFSHLGEFGKFLQEAIEG